MQVLELIQRTLRSYMSRLAAEQPGLHLRVDWSPAIVEWIAQRVEFADGYPLDGANAVESVCRFYAAGAFLNLPRKVTAAHREQCLADGHAEKQCALSTKDAFAAAGSGGGASAATKGGATKGGSGKHAKGGKGGSKEKARAEHEDTVVYELAVVTDERTSKQRLEAVRKH